jgi:multiple sugar transport system ATP-binding protein
MAEVRLEDLSKRYGDTAVLAGLTLTIRDGEFFALVGPSGCGKSTLLHLLAGLAAPSGGRILFDGRDVTPLEPRARDVAVVFQSYALYPHMTVAENLAFPLRVAGVARDRMRDEVGEVARRLGIEPLLQRRPRELSGGQRQRVALGRALIRKPRVFLLDEPLSNLDAPLRASMRAELRRLHDELKITMIYVTHDHTEAMTLGDRLAVLERGSIRQVGTPDEVSRRPADAFVAGFIGHPPMNLVEARVEGRLVVAGPLRCPLPPEHGGQLRDGNAVRLGIRPAELRVGSPSGTAARPGLSGGEVPATVRLIEPAGAHLWVTVEVEVAGRRETLVGLAEAGYQGRPGTPAVLTVDEATPHLFHLETGRRLGAPVDT